MPQIEFQNEDVFLTIRSEVPELGVITFLNIEHNAIDIHFVL